MISCPSFVAELTTQIELALRQQEDAGSRGDASAAEAAAGRIADLRDLLARNEFLTGDGFPAPLAATATEPA